jgi:hypothetical protein
MSEYHDPAFKGGGRGIHDARALSNSLHLHRLLLDGETLNDTSDGLAAMSVNHHIPTVVAKVNSNGVLLCASGADTFGLGGTLAAITSNVRGGVVTGGGRYNVIGTGGTKNAISNNGGVTWSAGGSTGLITALEAIVLTSSAPGLVVCSGNGGSAYSSNGGTSWTNPTSGADISDVIPDGGVTSMGVVASSVVVAVGEDASGHPKFARSTDGGVTWAAGSGTVPTAASQNDAGSVVGLLNGGALHAGHRNVQVIEVATSDDGSTWRAQSQITSLGTVSQVRLMSCPTTGLVVLAVLLSTGIVELRYSPYRGQAWSDPVYVADIDLNEFAVAGGRLFACNSGAGMMFASGRVL